MNRAGRHAGPLCAPKRAVEAAHMRELQVGDRVLYRRGSVQMDQVGVIEAVDGEHYWICTREGEAFRVRRYGQCVFYPPPAIIEQRAKLIRDTWFDSQLRARLGLMPLHIGELSDEPPANFAVGSAQR